MPKDPFLLVSLNEDKAKKLSQVLSNPTATRILDHLAKREATESEIAKELDIPLSTVHYNLKQLTEAKLVLAEEFHYSSRGKEVNHYKLANKYIIIAPAEEHDTFLQHIKKFLPATIVVAGMAVVLKAMQAFTGTTSLQVLPPEAAPVAMKAMVEDSARTMAADAALPAAAGAAESFNTMIVEGVNETQNEFVQEAVQETVQDAALAPHVPWWQSPMVDWFLIGAASVLAILLISEAVSWWRWKRKN